MLSAERGALVVALAILAAASSAAADRPTGVISVAPTFVVPGGTVTVTVNGGSSPLDWVGLYRMGGPKGGYKAWRYVPLLRPARLTFTMPSDFGPEFYDFRLFSNDSFTKLGTTQIVTVDTAGVLSVGDVTLTEGDNGMQSATFIVTRAFTAGPPAPVTVNYATANGTALAGSDYVATSGMLSFAFGESTQQLTVTVLGDSAFEPDETFFVNLSGVSPNATIQDAQGQGKISNDDAAPPSLTCPSTVAPGAQFIATVNAGSSSMDWVALYPAGAPNRPPPSNWQYVPLPRPRKRTFTAPALEGNYELRLFAENGYTLIGSCNILVAVGPALSISDTTLTEGNAGTTLATFIVRLSPAATSTVTVAYATTNGTASAGSDFVATSGTLTFAAGQVSQLVTVPVIGEAACEPDESFEVLLSAASAASISDGQGKATILNDEAGCPLACPADVVAGASFTATVTGGSSARDWVALYARGAPDDQPRNWLYVPLPRPATRTFTAPTTQGRYELRLFANDGYTLLGLCSFWLSPGSGPSLWINGEWRLEANTGTRNASFSVMLFPAATSTVTVNYTTSNGTASAGSDYVAVSGTLTFMPGETWKTIDVPVIGDTVCEPDESFSVLLSTASGGASIYAGQAEASIANDEAGCPFTCPALIAPGASFTATVAGGSSAQDWVALYARGVPDIQLPDNWQYVPLPRPAARTFTAPATVGNYELRLFANNTFALLGSCSFLVAAGPTLSFRDREREVVEGSYGTQTPVLTVTLNPPAQETVTVAYATRNGTATSGLDYQTISGTLAFAAGEIMKELPALAILGDTLIEPQETFFVELSSPTGGAVILGGESRLTIVDDDGMSCPLAAVLAGTAFDVTASIVSGATDRLVLHDVISGELVRSVLVPATRPATVTLVAPYRSRSYQLALLEGDGDHELAVCFVQVRLGPVLWINPATVLEGDGGMLSAEFTVTLSSSVNQELEVRYYTTDRTAKAGSDYVSTDGALTFLPGETAKTVTVPVTGDTDCEPDETFQIRAWGLWDVLPVGAGGIATIVNDDAGCGLAPTQGSASNMIRRALARARTTPGSSSSAPSSSQPNQRRSSLSSAERSSAASAEATHR